MVINYVGGPEAVPPSEQPEAARTGIADIVVIPSTYYEHLLPEARCFHLTMLRPWEERESSSGFYDHMVKTHSKINLFYLGRAMSEWGMHLWPNFEVENLREDFKGHKVALTSASTEEFMRRLGLSIVMVPTMDLFTSVERGVVDAWTWPVTAWFFGLHEVTKYCIDIRFGTAENVVYVMNLDKWNKLSKDQQEVLVKAMKSVELDGLPRDQQLYSDFRKKFEDAGTEFLKFSTSGRSSKMLEPSSSSSHLRTPNGFLIFTTPLSGRKPRKRPDRKPRISCGKWSPRNRPPTPPRPRRIPLTGPLPPSGSRRGVVCLPG
jgi:TRAP-type C4-dicarboxylate transport system substrate-binding protein